MLCVADGPTFEAVRSALDGRLGTTLELQRMDAFDRALEVVETLAVLLWDVALPGPPLETALARLRRKSPSTRTVLLLSPSDHETMERAGRDLPIDAYLEKPVRPSALYLTLSSLVNQHELASRLETRVVEENHLNAHLEALHRVGLTLASSFDIDFILHELAGAAAMLTGRRPVEIYYAGSRTVNALPRWYPEKSLFLTEEERARLEREAATPTDAGHLLVPIEHECTRLGLIVVDTDRGSRRVEPSVGRLLALLSLQAGAALGNIHLTQERIHFERLAAMGRMIGSIVHDFRSPITAARGYASMLAGPKPTLEQRRTYAALLLEECDRLADMTEDLLELTRSGSARLTRSWIRLSDYLRRLAADIERTLAGSGVQLSLELAFDDPVFIDAAKLTRAALNVATNARQAMPGGGALRVSTEKRGDRIAISFRDTGSGVPAAVAHRIFEPFFTYGKVQGIGLGTTIAKKIVEDHGGEIRFLTEEGRGTTVDFVLPLEPSGEVARPAEVATSSVPE